MKKEGVLKAIKEVRKQNKKRNFTQTAELIVALKDLDLKKPENQVELYVTLPEGLGKEIKIAGIVSPDMLEEAKKYFDLVLVEEDLEKYRKNKRLGKKLARSYDYFVASAPLMPKIAAAIGRYLGPLGRLPSPRAGTIIASKQQIPILADKLRKTVRIIVKKQPQAQVRVGVESMSDEALARNIETVYNQLIHHLPREEQNVKHVYFKFTMSKPVRVV